jgi:hypothetical protein
VVVAVLIAGALGWFFYRKRAARRQGNTMPPAELSSQGELSEMFASIPPAEMASSGEVSKIPPHASVVHEMDASDYRDTHSDAFSNR